MTKIAHKNAFNQHYDCNDMVDMSEAAENLMKYNFLPYN